MIVIIILFMIAGVFLLISYIAANISESFAPGACRAMNEEKSRGRQYQGMNWDAYYRDLENGVSHEEMHKRSQNGYYWILM